MCTERITLSLLVCSRQAYMDAEGHILANEHYSFGVAVGYLVRAPGNCTPNAHLVGKMRVVRDYASAALVSELVRARWPHVMHPRKKAVC